MTTQYTPILKLALPVQGELSGTWGDVVNDNITSMIEQAIAGRVVVDTWTTNSHVLTSANGLSAESRAAMLSLTDSTTALTGAGSVICPALSKTYIVKNSTAQIITVKTSLGTGIAVPVGKTMLVFCDGTNVLEGVDHVVTLSAGVLTIGGGTSVNYIDTDGTFTANSDDRLATQKATKLYVDTQVGTADTLSEVLALGNTTGGTDIVASTTDKVQFRDAAIYINSSADGQLDLVADTEVQITAPTVDLNGLLDLQGTLNIGTGGATVNLIDNGDVATNSAVRLATQQAVKTYVDAAPGTEYTAGTGLDLTGTEFSLEVATSTTLGGVELFSDTDQSVVANAVTTTASRTYGIQLNSDNQAVVNVPWVDTEYTAGTGLDLTNTEFSIDSSVVTLTGAQALSNKSGNISQWTNDSGYSTPSSTDTFTNKSGNISQWTNDSGYSTTTGTVTPSSVDTFTNKSGNISQWTNDSGYTTNLGDITAVTAGNGLTGGGTTGAVTLTVGASTGIQVFGSAVQLKQATSTERGGVELFSDTAQSVAANAVTTTASRTYGIQLNAANQAVVNVPWNEGGGIALTDLSATVASVGTANLVYNNTNGVFTYTPPDLSSYLTADSTATLTNKSGNISQWTNDSGYTTNVGDITAVTAGNGLTGGGTTGAVTLNAVGGTGITANANDISLDLATSIVRGGIELFSDTDQSVAANAVTTTASRTYGIQLNSSNQAVVNVPWVEGGGIALTDLSAVTASPGTTSLVYNNTNGVFTYTPSDLSSYLTADSTATLTNKSGNISQWTNDSGYTTNVGDITAVTAGNGLTGGGTSGAVTIDVVGGTGITANANDISLDLATSTVRGGVELFSDTDQPITANAVTTTASRTYGIQLNSSNQAVVNVPWVEGGAGDITAVTAGNGLTGGGTSGAVTIDVVGGDGITANANDIALDSTVVRTSGTQSIGGGKIFGNILAIDGSETGGFPLQRMTSSSVSTYGRIEFGYTGNVSRGKLQYNNTGDSMAFWTATSEKMRISSAGNVGIGTSSPSAALTVSNNGAEGIEFFPANQSGLNTTQHYNRAASAYVINNVIASEHIFNIGATERAKITSVGDILVNKTATNASVLGCEVKSNGIIYSTVEIPALSGGIQIRNNGATDSLTGLRCYNGLADINTTSATGGGHSLSISGGQSGEYARFTNAKRLGIGISAPTEALHVVGNIVATGNITANFSDERLKDFQGTIPNALDKVAQLNGYYYTPNETAQSLGVDNNGLEVGISAQEVEAVLPEIVAKSAIGEDYKTVMYERLTPLLIEAVKELTEKVEKLEARLIEMEK